MTSVPQSDNITKVLEIKPVTLEDMFMSYDKVSQAKSIIIGTKQTVKALKRGSVKEVVVAKDADSVLTAGVIQLAKNQNTAVCMVDSMKKLGKACGIEVGAKNCCHYVIAYFLFLYKISILCKDIVFA